jgi:hypothetical protein
MIVTAKDFFTKEGFTFTNNLSKIVNREVPFYKGVECKAYYMPKDMSYDVYTDDANSISVSRQELSTLFNTEEVTMVTDGGDI